ncbi:hypothetical protein IFM89_010336 [Coptis chinensis]|uniref:Uncharacterized protein n=1 Tax=Coptis chinensis TaxID=261450 RepID=A0A835LRH3_9MAGN|nr:hypothetical protein IFM89_010336 [Coptis chinensis]
MPKENSLLQEIGHLRKGSEGVEVHGQCRSACISSKKFQGSHCWDFKMVSEVKLARLQEWGSRGGFHVLTSLLKHGALLNFYVTIEEVFLFCQENANRASVASVTEVLEIKQNVIKESEDAEFEASHQCVFLLERMGGKIHPDLWAETKRYVCYLFAQEFDLLRPKSICLLINIPFLEWVDKGTKCPYCEGLGYNICDVCEGKTLIRA